MKGVVLDPAKDGKRFMRGNDEEKSVREIWWLIDKNLVGSDQFLGGLATFPPGMTAPRHVHPDAEEINVVMEGGGFHYSRWGAAGEKGRFSIHPQRGGAFA